MHRFLPHYPLIEKNGFQSEIASKLEFKKETAYKYSNLFPHQQFINRFISPYTPYDNLLLFHEMGSGKTQSAVSVAETLMNTASSGILKTIVIVRGQGLAQNFLNELVYKATQGKYITEKITKLWKSRYEFWTMEVFGKHCSKLSDNDLFKKFNNRLFIIDEAHHLKKKDEGPFKQIHRLLHLLTHRKVLLLTGTPIKDDVSELANLVNLILPMDKQLPYGKDFTNLFYDESKFINGHELKDRLTGLVSFHKGTGPNVKKIFAGKIIPPMEHIPVVACTMHPFQEKHYIKAVKLDEKHGSVYINSRQASLFVFPDGSFGKEGFEKYVRLKKTKSLVGVVQNTYDLVPELKNLILEDLGKFSAKFKKIIDAVTKPTNHKTFIYSEFVHGSGAILLSQVLKCFGYSQANGSETTPKKRFIIATNQSLTGNLLKLLDKFNSPANDKGELIQIFIGSQIISEGYSLRNITTEFILTPHWNFSEIEQIIARCWRLNSHTPDIKTLTVNLLTVSTNVVSSIDLYMYKIAETKDYKIKQLERLLKEISVDCHNAITFGNQGSRECDYTHCEVNCFCNPIEAQDQASFHIFYPPKEDLMSLFETVFRDTDKVAISDLLTLTKYPRYCILDFIAELLYANKPLIFKDQTVFLRKTGGFLYTTKDPTMPVTSLMPLTKITDYSISQQDLLNSLESPWLLNSVKLLFAATTVKQKKTLLYKLPRKCQHFLLLTFLYAYVSKNKSHKELMNVVLDYYKGFYQLGKRVYVWLFHEQFGTLELVPKSKSITWKPSKKDVYQEMRKKCYTSQVGYYGLYNPYLNEFCLRKAVEQKETDLRKIAVGRRCDDWDQKSLATIINTKLKLNVDISQYNRVDLCNMIKAELFAKNLVLYNFDCGNQFKVRGRF